VVLAGLINAAKVTGRNLSDCRIVLIGAGAAGVAVAKLLHKYARPEIIAVDSKGVISHERDDLNPEKKLLASFNKLPHDGYNPKNLREALKGADVVIGISKAGMLLAEDIPEMAKDPIIFALANPVPEIMPDEAKAAGAAIVATGRSDFPNQVNNAIAFPGIFRGALDNHIRQITDEHKVAAAEAIASLVKNPTPEEIIPSVFNDQLVPTIGAVIC
jgi:malate dehydrogenase (oxaloacetate-decarboxylating)